MAVYVDRLRPCIKSGAWKWDKSCHLLADSLEELHAFARKIGMKRAWFQNDGGHPHYDLNQSRRAVAVNKGAIEITDEQLRLLILKFFRSGEV